ncbi:MAG: hypothetical protein ACRENG_19980, partial [bacterium]
ATLAYNTPEYKGKIPAYHLTASSQLALDPALTRLTFSNGALQFEPGQASFGAVYDLTTGAFRFDLTNATLDLAQVRRVLPDTILYAMNYAKVRGRGRLNGWLKGQWLEPDSLDYNGSFYVSSENASYADTALGLYADSLRIKINWLLTASTIGGEYSLFCPEPKFPDYIGQPLRPTTVLGKINADERTFTIAGGEFNIFDWHSAGTYRVEGEFQPGGIQMKTTVTLSLHTPVPITVDRGLTLRGNVEANFVLDQYIPNAPGDPQPARFVGQLQSDGLDVTIDTLFSLRDLKADCHFDQEFDLLDLTLKPSQEAPPVAFANAGEALLMYDIFGDVMRNDVIRKNVMRENASGPSRITIGQIDAFGYQISDVVADLAIGNCRLDIPKFSMKLFDGNLAGNLLVGLGNGNPDSISYSTSMQLASIDISYFRRLSAQLGKSSRLSANFSLSGLGIMPEKLNEVVNNLEGGLNITKIENKVASNLLQMLDPNGTDKGIQNMRLLLKTRWNVRQITFEMKNGFIYASLSPVKPWFMPYSLPSTIDFARLPVRYFFADTGE